MREVCERCEARRAEYGFCLRIYRPLSWLKNKMTRDEADTSVHDYHHLVGKYSTNYKSLVDAIFVSQDYEATVESQYRALYFSEGYILEHRDWDKYMVWAKIGDKYVSASSVCIEG
jgi:hypothetical protein